MLTVRQLIAALEQFPEEAQCHAYEAEKTGIVVSFGNQTGFIACSEELDIDAPVELLDCSDQLIPGHEGT